jgi:hypothetical protein
VLETRNIFLIIIVLGLFGMAVRNVVDPDVWWHLKTGEYIVAHRAVPHADPFSYTRAAQPWVAHEWLTELFMYALYRAAGWGGLSIVFAVILSASFLLLYLRCPQNSYLSGAMAVWGAWATTPIWGVRAQVLSLLLASLWLLILEKSERNLRLLWWTLPLTLLWVNLHAGFALGAALLALFLAGEFLERFPSPHPASANPASANNARLRALALAFLVNLLLVPLNPNGARMYAYPIQTLRSKAMQTYISEWSSPNFHRADYWPFLLLLLAVVARLAWSRTSVRPRDMLLLLVSTFAALSSIRMIPLFVLIAVPLIAKAAGSWFLDRPPSRARPSRARHRLAFNAIILVAIAGFVAVHISLVFRQQTHEEAEHFPVGAAAFLAAHPPDHPIFNHYDWGGYLIWKLYPRTLVFIDGRADLYGDAVFQEFMQTYLLTKDWQQTLNRWQIGTVIVPPESALATGLRGHPGWSLRYEDRQAAVFSLAPQFGAVSASQPGPDLRWRRPHPSHLPVCKKLHPSGELQVMIREF